MRERENKQKIERNQKPSKKELAFGVAALAGTLLIPVGNAIINDYQGEQKPVVTERVISNEEAATILHDAEAIANKYTSCAITDISDLHTDPTRREGQVSNGPSRTTLSLTLAVERNPDAAEPLLRYDNASENANKADIAWSNPTLTAFVESNGMEYEVMGPGVDYEYEIPDSDMATDGHDPRTESEQFTIKVNPLAIPTDADAKMIFKVTTNASPRALDKPIIANTQECIGAAKYDQSVRGWVLEK